MDKTRFILQKKKKKKKKKTHEQGSTPKKTKNPRNSTHEMLRSVNKLDPLCLPKPSFETILPVVFGYLIVWLWLFFKVFFI